MPARHVVYQEMLVELKPEPKNGRIAYLRGSSTSDETLMKI
jgi:hypothetical protein